jgi:hypothetical protein
MAVLSPQAAKAGAIASIAMGMCTLALYSMVLSGPDAHAALPEESSVPVATNLLQDYHNFDDLMEEIDAQTTHKGQDSKKTVSPEVKTASSAKEQLLELPAAPPPAPSHDHLDAAVSALSKMAEAAESQSNVLKGYSSGVGPATAKEMADAEGMLRAAQEEHAAFKDHVEAIHLKKMADMKEAMEKEVEEAPVPAPDNAAANKLVKSEIKSYDAEVDDVHMVVAAKEIKAKADAEAKAKAAAAAAAAAVAEKKTKALAAAKANESKAKAKAASKAKAKAASKAKAAADKAAAAKAKAKAAAAAKVEKMPEKVPEKMPEKMPKAVSDDGITMPPLPKQDQAQKQAEKKAAAADCGEKGTAYCKLMLWKALDACTSATLSKAESYKSAACKASRASSTKACLSRLSDCPKGTAEAVVEHLREQILPEAAAPAKAAPAKAAPAKAPKKTAPVVAHKPHTQAYKVDLKADKAAIAKKAKKVEEALAAKKAKEAKKVEEAEKAIPKKKVHAPAPKVPAAVSTHRKNPKSVPEVKHAVKKKLAAVDKKDYKGRAKAALKVLTKVSKSKASKVVEGSVKKTIAKAIAHAAEAPKKEAPKKTVGAAAVAPKVAPKETVGGAAVAPKPKKPAAKKTVSKAKKADLEKAFAARDKKVTKKIEKEAKKAGVSNKEDVAVVPEVEDFDVENEMAEDDGASQLQMRHTSAKADDDTPPWAHDDDSFSVAAVTEDEHDMYDGLDMPMFKEMPTFKVPKFEEPEPESELIQRFGIEVLHSEPPRAFEQQQHEDFSRQLPTESEDDASFFDALDVR